MTAPTEPASTIVPGLRWAIKRSFIDYIRRMPDGQGSLSNGARPVDADRILFEPDPEVPAPEGAERFWAFRGDARFRGHAGLLFVRVAEPRLTVRGTRAELSIDDSGSGGAGRVALVTLRLEPGPSPAEEMEVWYGSEVVLTEAGVELFNDVYPSGEPFEPLTVVVPRSPAC